MSTSYLIGVVAAIIGVGMAGLTTATYLARAGFAVQVYEQHTLPGGYDSSFIRKGFTFPTGPICFGSNGIIFPILKELGLDVKQRFVRIRHQISCDKYDNPRMTTPVPRVCLHLSRRNRFIHHRKYQNLEQLDRSLLENIKLFYNQKRLHTQQK